MTKNGKMILEIIRESEDHMTAEQIFMKAKEISPRIVLATVYNNLNSLVSEGLVRRIKLDGSPDILIDADEKFIVPIAELCKYFKEEFGALRSLVESVTVHPGVENAAIIKLRSGMSVAIKDWQTDGEKKISKAYLEYCAASDSQRVDGIITVGA